MVEMAYKPFHLKYVLIKNDHSIIIVKTNK